MDNEERISHHTGRSLFTHNFVLGFIVVFVFQLAFQSIYPAIPIYFAKLGSTEREVGLLVGIMGIAAVVSRFFAGAVLTRYSEKRVILCGTVLFAFTYVAFILFRPFWPLFAVRFSQGVAFACCHTAALAYIVNITPPAQRGQGLSYFMLSSNFAMAIAAPTGMFLINRYGFTTFFLSCAGLSLCSFLLAGRMKGHKNPSTLERTSLAASAFLPEMKIIVPSIAGFLHMFVYGALTAFVPLYALHRGVTNPGLFFAATAVAMMAGRAFGGRVLDTYDKEKLILILIIVCMVAMIILSFSKTVSMFIFVGLLWGTGASFFVPASMAYALEYSGSSSGRALGSFNAFLDLGMALGPAVTGLIVPVTGYPAMFLFLALICLMLFCYFQFYVRTRGSEAQAVS
ncbi:MAG TPA: MFS transporter [Syntrophorhabdaceae bacterium]|nr:MFS transporter [Syntrophorhabdaceae bacterium]